ncbi:hypothetical protein C8Q70DRAFT_453016 [Cubamyces menziesii]|nr:hypothetical protein C8Q70DRAFT_453016 [Cubamyces menziesii]
MSYRTPYLIMGPALRPELRQCYLCRNPRLVCRRDQQRCVPRLLHVRSEAHPRLTHPPFPLAVTVNQDYNSASLSSCALRCRAKKRRSNTAAQRWRPHAPVSGAQLGRGHPSLPH